MLGLESPVSGPSAKLDKVSGRVFKDEPAAWEDGGRCLHWHFQTFIRLP